MRGPLKVAEKLSVAKLSDLSANETVKKMFETMKVREDVQLKVVFMGVDLSDIYNVTELNDKP